MIHLWGHARSATIYQKMREYKGNTNNTRVHQHLLDYKLSSWISILFLQLVLFISIILPILINLLCQLQLFCHSKTEKRMLRFLVDQGGFYLAGLLGGQTCDFQDFYISSVLLPIFAYVVKVVYLLWHSCFTYMFYF